MGGGGPRGSVPGGAEKVLSGGERSAVSRTHSGEACVLSVTATPPPDSTASLSKGGRGGVLQGKGRKVESQHLIMSTDETDG